MYGRAASRRRGRGAGLHGVLVERERELAVLQSRLAEARNGEGGMIFINAPVGNGKSRLLTIAGDLAREAGMQVLGAQGAELERDFPFGVAIQLFEPRWFATDAQTRERLLEGPARWAGDLLSGSSSDTFPAPPFPADRGYSVIHGLFWIARNLATHSTPDAASAAIVMLVDDAHWADGPSLRFLAYLAERIGELPILLVVTARDGEQTADRRALAALQAAAEDAVLAPKSLTPSGVAAIAQSEFPHAESTFCQACHRTTNGNPFLLVELLEQLRVQGLPADGATAGRLADLAPESVLNSIVLRLESMPEEHREVAAAVAVLGDGAPLRQVAALARLDIETSARAADSLAAVQLLHPGAPLSFVHPLVRAAVKTTLSPFERGRAHRRAAEILAEEGGPEEQTALHLLDAAPEADPDSVEVLRAAGRKAMASGAAESAVRMLERAVSELPDAAQPELVAELAEAEVAAGLSDRAIPRFETAIRGTRDSDRRTELALKHADALQSQMRRREAADVLAAALQDAAPRQIDELEAAYVAVASMIPDLGEHARHRGAEMMKRIGSRPSPRQRTALAHIALDRALHSADRDSVVEAANASFGDAALMDGDHGRKSWPLLIGALLFVDELERGIEICDAAAATHHGDDSAATHVAASYCRAWPLYMQGRVREALAQAKLALDAPPDEWQSQLRSAYGAVASCRLLTGELGQAERALSALGDPEVQESIQGLHLLEVRARLRLAQRRPAEALTDATDAGRRLAQTFGLDSPGIVAWRSTAALAHLALGDRVSARRLATEELERARECELVRVAVRDLRILGMIEQGESRLQLLSEAVELGAHYPTRLEYIQALVDFGAALRRANHRLEAREPLRKALELSQRGGATAIAIRARTELRTAGARPRRAMLSGVDALTPSELRVGQLASAGLTNRQVAETLFVSPKTVEFHLRGIYRKLGVSSRDALAEAMGKKPVSRAA